MKDNEKIVKKLMIYGFIGALVGGSVDTFLPIYLRSLGFSIPEIGLLLSLGTILLMASPIIGLVSDYLERRLFLKINLILSSIGTFLYPINAWIGRVIDLFGRTIGEPILMPMLVEFCDKKKLTSTIALFGGIMAIAWVGGPLIAGYLIQTTNYTTFFTISAIITIGLIFLIPKKEPKPRKHKLKFDLKISRTMKILLIINIIYGTSEGIRQVLYSLVYSEFYSLTTSAVGFFIGLSSIFYFLPIIVSHKKLDKLKSKWFIILSLCIGIIISLATYYITNFTIFYMIVLLGVANYAFFFPFVDKITADGARGKFKAFDMALPSLTYMVGLVIGNLLSSPISEIFGVKGVFMFHALADILMLPLFFLI